MFKKISVIMLFALFCFPVLSQSSDRTEADSASSRRLESNKPTPGPISERLSLLSPERFTQNRALSFGYYSDGKTSASVTSYLHSFGMALSSRLDVNATMGVHYIRSANASAAELSPTFRLDWRPGKDTRLIVNLKLSPVNLSGEGFGLDFRRNPDSK